MSIEFVIIPITPNAVIYAEEISAAIKAVVPSSITIDTDYNVSLTKKLIKHKQKGIDIITITDDNVNSKQLTIRYADKGSKPETIYLDEFIELVQSYYDEGTKDNVAVEIKDEPNTTDKEGGCIIC